MVNFNPYEEQGPEQAYIRWLAERQSGGAFSSPIRKMLEARGRYQSSLAPLFGYGISEDIGGQGKDFAPFYSQNEGRAPRWADIRQRLQGMRGALGAGENANAYQTVLAGQYDDPEEQLDALGSGLASQVNPYFRGGLSSQLGRRYRDQQATDPNTRFIDYAAKKGWF